jgi:hypothetical protein
MGKKECGRIPAKGKRWVGAGGKSKVHDVKGRGKASQQREGERERERERETERERERERVYSGALTAGENTQLLCGRILIAGGST